MPSKLWDKITYPFANSNALGVAVWEWRSDFFPHFIIYVITHSLLKYISKKAPVAYKMSYIISQPGIGPMSCYRYMIKRFLLNIFSFVFVMFVNCLVTHWPLGFLIDVLDKLPLLAVSLRRVSLGKFSSDQFYQTLMVIGQQWFCAVRQQTFT